MAPPTGARWRASSPGVRANRAATNCRRGQSWTPTSPVAAWPWALRPPVRFFEVDPLDELERMLAARPQRFRLQFFGVGADHGPAVLTETEIQAADASGAIREATAANWPPRAVGLRLVRSGGARDLRAAQGRSAIASRRAASATGGGRRLLQPAHAPGLAILGPGVIGPSRSRSAASGTSAPVVGAPVGAL